MKTMPPITPISRVMKRVKDLFIVQLPVPPTKIRPTSYDVVHPQDVSEKRKVPDCIQVPEYVLFGNGEEEVPALPTLKETEEEIKLMKASSRLARKILNAAKSQIKVGLTTDELDKYVHDLIIEHKAYPSPLLYRGFPKSICTSVNNIVCHGIPDNRPLVNGDIVTVDVSVFHQGYHGDCAATFLVGNVDDEGRYLVEKSEEILLQTISTCKPGMKLDIIGTIITKLAKAAQLTVIPCVCGHGIGQYFHEKPCIDHYSDVEQEFGGPLIDADAQEGDETMVPGLTFTIEPVFGTGCQETELYDDGWTVATADDSRTAQFEHTILITDDGAEILTE